LSPFLRRVLRTKSRARCCAGAGSRGRSTIDLSSGSPGIVTSSVELQTEERDGTNQDRWTNGQRSGGRTPVPVCAFGDPSRIRWRRRQGCKPGRCIEAIRAWADPSLRVHGDERAPRKWRVRSPEALGSRRSRRATNLEGQRRIMRRTSRDAPLAVAAWP
jgi:hypothetical protein